MNMNKLAEMFGVTKEDENLQQTIETLTESYNVTKKANEMMAKEIIELETELDNIKNDVGEFVEKEIQTAYYNMLADIKSAEEECKIQIKKTEDECEKKIEASRHRWIAEGRQRAYYDMGIWNIEAHERGNVLVQNKEGDIFEIITDLEDVKPDEDVDIDLCGITIDDLVEV